MYSHLLILGFVVALIAIFAFKSSRDVVLIFSVLSAIVSVASNYTNMRIARYRLAMDYGNHKKRLPADADLDELIDQELNDEPILERFESAPVDFNLERFKAGPAQMASQARAVEAATPSRESADRVTGTMAPAQYADFHTRHSIDDQARHDARLRNNRHRIQTDSRMNFNRNVGILFAEEFKNEQSKDWWQRNIDDSYKLIYEDAE